MVPFVKFGPSLESVHRRISNSETAWKKRVFMEKEVHLTKVYMLFFFISSKQLLKTLGSSVQ